MFKYLDHTADIAIYAENNTIENTLIDCINACINLMIDIKKIPHKLTDKKTIQFKSNNLEDVLYKTIQNIIIFPDINDSIIVGIDDLMFKELNKLPIDRRDIFSVQSQCHWGKFQRNFSGIHNYDENENLIINNKYYISFTFKTVLLQNIKNDIFKTELKAITYAGLKFEKQYDKYIAKFLIDV